MLVDHLVMEVCGSYYDVCYYNCSDVYSLIAIQLRLISQMYEINHTVFAIFTTFGKRAQRLLIMYLVGLYGY